MTAADNALLDVVCFALGIYWLLVLIWVILSWVELAGWRRPIAGPGRTAIELLDDVIRPAVTPLRRVVPTVRLGAFGLDLSVLVLFVIIFVLRSAIC
jgi:YggT family protein